MSGAHLHLLLNHVPVLGTFFGLALLLLGLLRRSDEILRAAWLGLLASALLAVPTYFSGEPAEDAVKGQPQVSEWLIEQHEEAAEKGLVAILVLGVVCLAALVVTRGERPASRALVGATLLLGLAAGALLGYAASLGGQIRHAEIRPGAAASRPSDAGAESHDDDH